MFLFFVGVAILSVMISHKVWQSIFSPVGVFGICWNGLLALSALRLAEYNSLAIGANLVLAGSFFLFLAGTFVARLGYRSGSLTPTRRPTRVLGGRGARAVLRLLNGSTAVGLLLYLLSLARGLGVSRIADTAYVHEFALRASPEGLPGQRIASYLLSLAVGAAIIGGIYCAEEPKSRRMGTFPLFAVLTYSFISGSRALFIWVFLLWASSYLLTRVALGRMRSLGRASLLAILILSAVFAIIGGIRGGFSFVDPWNLQFMRLPLPGWLAQIYLYLTAPFAAFAEYLARYPLPATMWGQNLFTPVAKALVRLRLIDTTQETLRLITIRPAVVTPLIINTFTYLREWYDDFGIMGILIGPFVIGFASGYSYLKVVTHPTFTSITVASLLYLQLMFAFSCSITSFNPIWLAVIVCLLCAPILERKESRALQEEK